MSAESIIKDSIKKAQADGIQIVRGPVHYWEGNKLIGCDCFGAVMYAHGHSTCPGFQDIPNPKPPQNAQNPNLWIYKLFSILEKDVGWWSRYHHGFHHQRQLLIEVQDSDGKKKLEPCNTSKKAWDLSVEVGSIDIHEFILSEMK